MNSNFFFKSIRVYFFAGVISKLIPFLLLPFITNVLLPEEYGQWALFSVIVIFTSPFIGLLLKNQITRKYYKLSKEKLAILFTNILLINIVMLILSLFFFFFLSFFYANKFELIFLLLIPIISFLSILKEYLLTILRYENKPYFYGVLEITNSLLFYLIGIFFIVHMNYKWEGMVFGMLITISILVFFSMMYLIRENFINFNLNFDFILDSLKHCIPLIPHAIFASLVVITDRLIIENILGSNAVGVYTIGYSLGMIIKIFAESFKNSWMPWIYKKLNKVTFIKKVEVVRATYLYYLSIVLIGILVNFFSYIYLINFINENYHKALYVIYWSSATAIINSYYSIIFPYMNNIGKTLIFSITTFIASTFNIFLTIILVKKNGIVGAAQATFFSFLLTFVIVFIYSQINYPMPWLKALNKKHNFNL